MIAHDLKALEHALTDRNRGHDDDELAKAIALGEFESAAQINIGFTRAGLHLDCEIKFGDVSI